jgi:inhibitor of KinA
VTRPEIVALGDACLSVVFEEKIDPAVNDACVALATQVERRQVRGVRDVVPGYHTLAVHFDRRVLSRSDLHQELERAIAEAAGHPVPAEREPIEIRVTYGGATGPDLTTVAAYANCSEQDAIRLHTAVVYRVYMIGFVPGFAHLGSVDPRIAMPRLDSPRIRVPAGSVGIAGAQTGIYPRETPGGWRIIGRTDAQLFDATRDKPSMLTAGDRVRFVAV